MFYKLSNSANREEVEKSFRKKFRFPSVYEPKMIVDGLAEDNLYMLTADDPDRFNIAIWGLMPEGTEEEWQSFQHVSNTLNITGEMLRTVPWMQEVFHRRRCLILATGFFSYRLDGEQIRAYYVTRPGGGPFLLGGITTELEDGFCSCALLTVPLHTVLKPFHDVDDQMPLIIPESKAGRWLSEETEAHRLESMLSHSPEIALKAKAVSRSFFENYLMCPAKQIEDSAVQSSDREYIF